MSGLSKAMREDKTCKICHRLASMSGIMFINKAGDRLPPDHERMVARCPNGHKWEFLRPVKAADKSNG